MLSANDGADAARWKRSLKARKRGAKPRFRFVTPCGASSLPSLPTRP